MDLARMTTIEIAQPTIAVDVRYYDHAEEERFKTYPLDVVQSIDRLVKRPVEVDTSDFLTFVLFHRMQRQLPGYEDISAIQKHLGRAIGLLDSCVKFTGSSIAIPSKKSTLPSDITERIGEAIGLAVTSKIHGLTDADWTRLEVRRHPESRTLVPTFDFQASDAKRYVQVSPSLPGNPLMQLETKGTTADDNRRKTAQVSKQRSAIHEKKYRLANLPPDRRDLYPSALRYGTITVLSAAEDRNVQCWLVDPPAFEERDPRVWKLITRMRFLSQWISLVIPRSQLAAALATRVLDLAAVINPLELNGRPLVRSEGKEFFFSKISQSQPHLTFFSNKFRVRGQPAGGVAVPLGRNQVAMLGIQQELVDMAARQDFDEILEYRFDATSRVETIVSTLSGRSLRRLNPSARFSRATLGEYRDLVLRGRTYYSSSGLCFGFYALEP